MDILAFLPIENSKNSEGCLRNIVPDESLLDYFDTTYINGKYL